MLAQVDELARIAEDGPPPDTDVLRVGVLGFGLADRWPHETWETTHLGGHRFAGTLLALPSGQTLGRLTPDNAVAACAEVSAGGVPLALSRGRAGRGGAEQVRELHVLAGGRPDVEVREVVGPPRRQSCGDLAAKPSSTWRVVV